VESVFTQGLDYARRIAGVEKSPDQHRIRVREGLRCGEEMLELSSLLSRDGGEAGRDRSIQENGSRFLSNI